jgi:hypothetical protein
MKRPRHLDLLILILLAAVPAYANNPPAPDGLLSLILIFVVAFLALRFSEVSRPLQPRWKVVGRGFLLFVAFFFTLGGTEIALIPLTIILGYGVYCGLQIMHDGKGGKRFVLGGLVIVVTILAIGDYMLSLNVWDSRAAEMMVPSHLRRLATAEAEFQRTRKQDVNTNGIGEFGTVEQLLAAGLIDPRFTSTATPYRYHVVLRGDPAQDEKGFFAYAVPAEYYTGAEGWRVMPGASYFALKEGRKRYARRSFAVDASGVIRETDLGATRNSVTPEEAVRWTPVQ